MINYEHPRIQSFLLGDYDKAFKHFLLSPKEEGIVDHLVLAYKLFSKGMLSSEKYMIFQKKALSVLKKLIKEQEISS